MAATFKIVFTGKKGDVQTPLTGRIIVDSNCEIGANGVRLLSVDCVSATELEAEANALKKHLDEIVSSAKREFQK